MSGLEDVAAGGGGPDIILPGDLADEPRLKFESFAKYEADSLTPEGDFPKYGNSFFEVVRESPNGDGWEESEDPVYALIPSQLAGMVLETVEEEVGSIEEAVPELVSFDVDFAGKSDGGRWQFMADVDVASHESR